MRPRAVGYCGDTVARGWDRYGLRVRRGGIDEDIMVAIDPDQACPDESVRRLQSILDYNTDWIWEVDAEGRYTYASHGCLTLLGRTPEQVIGKTPFDFMPDGEKERVLRIFEQYASRYLPFKGLVNRNFLPDGSIVVLETSGVPLFSPAGEFMGYRGIDRDITDIGERFLQLEAIYDFVPVPLCVVDSERCFVMANAALCRLLNLANHEVESRPVEELTPALDTILRSAFEALAERRSIAQSDVEIEGHWFHLTIKSFPGDPPDAPRLSVAMAEITAQKRVEQELARMNRRLARHAHEDYLTGLYNRRHLDGVLRSELARSRREGYPTSLLLMDLDHFKQYNDRYGHLAGDECLRRVAERLTVVIGRETDCVGRYGGEEFLAILPNTVSQGTHAVALRLQEELRTLVLPREIMPAGGITLSMGIATAFPLVGPGEFDAEVEAERLLGAADLALYQAKMAGRNRIIVHEPLVPVA